MGAPESPQRWIPLDSCQNFRDFGGYATAEGLSVRWRVLFRSDTLHRLTPKDVETLRSLDIGAVVDLRASAELRRNGQVAEAVLATHHHLPMFDVVVNRDRAIEERPPPGQAYIQMLDGAAPAISGALRVVLESAGRPVVIHCTAGKDRTGILAGLLLSALGVADDTVVEDYVLTNECRAARDAYLAVHDPEYLAMLESMPAWVRDADGRAMQATLDYVRGTWGSATGYFQSTGVTEEEVDLLRKLLLQPTSGSS